MPVPERVQPLAFSTTAAQPGSGALSLKASAGSPSSGLENRLVPAEPAMLAENTQPAALFNPTGELASNTLSVRVTPDNQGSVSSSGRAGLGQAESMSETTQAVESREPALILVASAIPQAGTAATPPSATPESAAQTDLSTVMGSGLALSEPTNGQVPATSILNSAAQLAPGRPALHFAAPRMADAVPGFGVRGASQSVGAPTSLPASASATGSEPDNGWPLASQTPFSVFFSGPGPGTESAASTLPKMILPVTGAAIRENHMSSPSQAAANSETSGPQNGPSQAAATQNTSHPAAGTETGSSQAGQPLPRSVEPSAASAQAASSPNGAAPVPAPPSSAAATLPLPQTALPAETLPKPDTLPGSAPGAPANLVSQSGETPAAITPGPVQMAQLINRVEQSEMRIGMNTSAFGSVEVRAVVHASDVGLVIGSEKGDLRSLMANDMPAIANTLQQQSLRLNSVNFMQGFAFSNNASGGGDSQQRSFVPARAFAGSALSDAAGEDSVESLAAGEFGGGSNSLSILA
jgi:hypothetical protein